ncbi:hypothetical protein F5Y16DRAFT_164982 [Xylariaceae sp. FL0255]|nr:hypothetical protein F5Y16DRAFT_164982 [Xylariaceae sp. FL0255]
MRETHATTVMSAAIFGFTVITIIFTPLSFMVGLFALPVDQFQLNTNQQYTTPYLGRWLAVGEISSLVVTIVAIGIASQYFLDLKVTQYIRNYFPSFPQIEVLRPCGPQAFQNVFKKKRIVEGDVNEAPTNQKQRDIEAGR